MVGQRVLVPHIGVRALSPEPVGRQDAIPAHHGLRPTAMGYSVSMTPMEPISPVPPTKLFPDLPDKPVPTPMPGDPPMPTPGDPMPLPD